MRYRNVMNRRTFLRGAGTVAIPLPFLSAMHSRSVWGADEDVPVRAFNLFFGLGFPTPLQTEGYDGPMAPLGELADKMLVVRGVDHVRADIGGANAHFDGATTSFNAIPSEGEVQAGGPSIDQVIRRQMYPDGQPDGVIPTLLAGTWFRRSRPGRYIHCWNEDGSPADLPYEHAGELFTRIFGDGVVDDTLTPEQERRLRYQRSILDSIVPQYNSLMGGASKLGTRSKARISDHLDNIREHEKRLFEDAPNCFTPRTPGPSEVPHDGAADPDGEGIDLTVDELVTEWRLIADLYVLGIQCDRVRFGGLTYQAAGERIRLSGDYSYNGELINTFNDSGLLGSGGSGGCAHEWWHQFNPGNANEQMRAHIHMTMNELTYVLRAMDNPMYADPNGKTILENSLVSISTESGDGRHNDVNRELSGIFHAFSSGCGRVATGGIVDADAEGLDVYNTILREGYGLDVKLGPDNRDVQTVGVVLP